MRAWNAESVCTLTGLTPSHGHLAPSRGQAPAARAVGTEEPGEARPAALGSTEGPHEAGCQQTHVSTRGLRQPLHPGGESCRAGVTKRQGVRKAVLWQDWENLQGQAQASGRSDKNVLVTSRRLLRSAASSPRRTPGWGRRESQLPGPRTRRGRRRGRRWGEQRADGQCGLKEGTPSRAVA